MKRFNTTGLCVSRKHYMVDITNKLTQIEKLIENEDYFVINKPRQYGKTTTLNELYKRLKNKYKVIKISFEGIISDFDSETRFCSSFADAMQDFFDYEFSSVKTFKDLIKLIKKITHNSEVILIIDEVDRASNNKLFLDFLSVLRALYLDREAEMCTTFKSVILAGVHDIKNLKLKFRDDNDIKYNSPWNIAVNFSVDMSFNSLEIKSMLDEYVEYNNLSMDTKVISEEIYKFTSGYPFLVSRICQVIDEDLGKDSWNYDGVRRAIKIILDESNTLFDDLVKNLENNKNLYDYMYSILILGITKIYNIDNPIISIGSMFGYLVKGTENNVEISNKIIKERIYNYMISKTEYENISYYNFKSNFITTDNGLDMRKVLLKFQEFMKKNYTSKDIEFLERQGVLLFLAFIKPIINGVGFDYKEVQISEERRLDIVVQYNNHKYVIETKIWHGEKAHKNGVKQLANYLEIENLQEGYLLIFNFNKNKQFDSQEISVAHKTIFEVRV